MSRADRVDIKQMEDRLRDYLAERELCQAGRALEMAVGLHEGQKRYEGIPYIVHPMTMACHALSMGVDEDELLAVMLLHDVCEDCNVTSEELDVNDIVRRGVDAITFVQKEGEDKEVALERYYRNMRNNREASLSKLFDRCHNVSTMAAAFPTEKAQAYIRETKRYVYPLLDYVRETYPEFSPIVFALDYHMKSVIGAFEYPKTPM